MVVDIRVTKTYNIGNYGFRILFTLTERETGDLKDITGLVPVFKMWIPGSTFLYINRVCAIHDADKGECTYLVEQGDFNDRGIYHAEVELQNGSIEDSETFEIILQGSSPKPCPVSYEVDGDASVVLDLNSTTSM